MRKLTHMLLAGTLILACSSCGVETTANYQVIPLPQEVALSQESPFNLNDGTIIAYPENNELLKRNAEFLAEYISQSTGHTLQTEALAPGSEAPKGAITLGLDPAISNREGYVLTVKADRVTLNGQTENGVFYGIQTLRKSIPAETKATSILLPAGSIQDEPRFSYRGMHLDVGRHFFPIEFVKKYIDLLALHNMNTFHWHLTEDQGWRIEIKKYPKLTEVGAWRNSKVLAYGDVKTDGQRYGGFYTQNDIKEIVAYAKTKFVEIIPEIDIPGHSQAAVAAYPEFLACDPENMHEVWLRQGISTDVINVANPQAMQFARDVIDELIDLFPFRYIHLGGDECPTNKWQKNEECQSLLKEMGSTNFRDLQIYFYKQLKDYMATKPANQQRRLVFWNEVLHGNTALLGNDITIMAWIGADAAAQNAAKQGMSTILSPQIPYYINRRQSDLPTEPMSQGHGTETVEAVYNYQPMKGVEADLQPYYSGVQANFWTEWVVDSSVLEYLMLPRLAAVAEAGWTPQEKRDYVSFKERIRKDAVLYDLKGWNYGKHIMK